MEIRRYTKDLIKDVIEFEKELRVQEDDWGWEINDEYIKSVTNSFDNIAFSDSISFLAYIDGKVVGRIDSSLINSYFDGSTKAYLDWICVLKNSRHKGVAQALMNELRGELKNLGIDTLIGLIAGNDEAQSFYKALPDSIIRDQGIWIDIK